MNYNIAAYSIYAALMIFIIGYVGNYFYRNGRVFILSLFHDNSLLTDQVNKLLLIAYYLFNIGYAFLKIRQWATLANWEMVVSSLAQNMGLLILMLAVLHFMNMLIIYYLSKSKSISITNKSIVS